jgi:myosin heavy subunit
VTYDTAGFLEKNRDPLPSESIQLLSSCKCELSKHFASVMVADPQNKSSLSWHSVKDTQKQSVVMEFKVLIQIFHSFSFTDNIVKNGSLDLYALGCISCTPSILK